MTEEQVLTDPHYMRGAWMLEHQVSSVEDFVRFWKLFGKPLVKVPDLEVRPNWDVVN